MPNIQFNYLYRDGSNYKNFDSVVFANPDELSLQQLENLIRSKLIDDTWFYNDEWFLPGLFFTNWSNSTDPTWHEFESVAYTYEVGNAPVTLAEFMKTVVKIKSLF